VVEVAAVYGCCSRVGSSRCRRDMHEREEGERHSRGRNESEGGLCSGGTGRHTVRMAVWQGMEEQVQVKAWQAQVNSTEVCEKVIGM